MLSKRSSESDMETQKSKDPKKTVFMSPSEYIKQVLANPEKIICNKNSSERIEATVFTPNPKIIVFQKFVTENVYSISLQIRNTSQVPHRLKLVSSENVFFNVVFKGSTLNTRLAPGMTHIYDVEFHPDEKRDYYHDIKFKTDVGSFSVPVIAVGPRPLFSFPEQIDMGQTAIKVLKTKPILMQNVGDIFTGFSIFTDNPCFTVTPSKGSVEMGEAIQVKVNLTPTKVGLSNGCIFIRYESGDTVQTVIYGEAVKCDVRIRNDDLVIDSTYLGLSRIASIEIQNNSNYLLQYEWMRYGSTDEDLQEREKCKKEIQPLKELPQDATILPDVQKLICQRIYSDKVELLTNKSFEFSNDHFQLFPMNGEVWPRSSTEVSVTFQPKKVGDLSTFTYLEIDGLEDRIPVSLSGKCTGPALELNLLSLDVQQVYLCSTYNYEIVCKNAGPVPGTLMYVNKNADFGSKIMVEPSEILVDVDELKSMNLSFYSDRTGNFIERVDFVIKESNEVLSFVMKGKVICPIVRTGMEEVFFNPASLGFTMKKQLRLRNLSHALIEYYIRVPSDGYQSVISHEEFARAQTKPRLPLRPREFSIRPNQGVIKPQTSISVEVLYTPNIARSGDIQLQIDLCKSSNAEPLLIPISFLAKSASISIYPVDLSIRFCFINFPYCRNLTVTNNSEVKGYFYFAPQEAPESMPLLYSLSTYQGYLKPGQSKEIALTLIIKEIGLQKIYLSLYSLGQETPSACCEITCKGEGPVISAEPSHLDWGEVQLLQKTCLTFILTNDSPISAEFITAFTKNKSIWEVDPPCGELSPNESISLDVYVFLRDTGKYLDRLLISIFNGKTVTVNLSVIGVGTCITFNPEILPVFDMGFLFSRQHITIPILVKNEGIRHHHVLLTNTENARQVKKGPAEEVEKSKYQIEPNILDLPPEAEETIYCKIRWDLNKVVSEEWYVYATIEGQGKRKLLGISTFTATFIDPQVTFDKCEITFRLDYDSCNCNELLQESELIVTNQSGRNLTAHITIEPPFLIIDECHCDVNDFYTILKNEVPLNIKIIFPFDIENAEPKPYEFCGCLKIEYEEHNKHIDKIACKAEVNFPNLVFIPNEINLYCISGYSSEERIKVVNDSPLTVFYKIRWIKESFSCESFRPPSEGASEALMKHRKCILDTSSSSSSPKEDNDSSSAHKGAVHVKRLCQCTDDFHEYCIIDLCECAEALPYDSSSEESQHELVHIHTVDKFFQITPEEGQIGPYNETYITIVFNGLECAKVSVKAICEITKGKDKILHVTGTADNVRCEVEDYILDYGLQLFSEPSVTALKVINQCMIPLEWCIEMSSDLLKVVETPQVLQPASESLILVERRPSAPGLFIEKLFLEVTHLQPFIIEVKWLATIPQIYLDIPRTSAFDKYPAEFGYRAIPLVMAEITVEDQNFVKLTCLSDEELPVNKDENITQFELMQLIDANWNLIAKDEKYPSQIDIDMAFERLIVIDYIKSYRDSLKMSNYEEDNLELSDLLAPIYVVNMNYVVVEQIGKLSLDLRNYGYEKAKIKLKREEQKRKSPKSCFFIKLERNTEICQCESTFLNIIFSPKKDIFSQRRTDVSFKFYLEIKQGLTIPVNVKAAACYPYLVLSERVLNFDKVFVGQCREMSFLLKNEGPVDCQWEITIENTSKNSTKIIENPFFIGYTNDKFIPGQEAIIKVYYKPCKNGNQKRNLIITIQSGQNTETIHLLGCGIDWKLNVDRATIKFPPVISNAFEAEEYFTIENSNLYPIELYWQHLNDFSESNRVIRILRHYYRIGDILTPERKLGDNIPQSLIDFYKFLVDQMYLDEDFKQIIENMIQNDVYDDSQSNITTPPVNLTNNLQIPSPLSNLDVNEIETLVHAYIDKLQEDPNFLETMKNPLTELYKTDDESITDASSEKTEVIMQKLIIIFHGAPFTEYQETACRSAKALKLPLLNINQIILESLALNETEPAKKLANILDSRYKDLTMKFTKQASKLNDSTRVFDILKKIPPIEEFEKMDTFTSEEHKLEMVIELTNLLGSVMGKGKSNVKDQDVSGKKQNIFPGITQDLFKEILTERLSQPKFKHGFVLQTLNNDFIIIDVMTLKTLLEAIGKEEAYYFVTFYNSMELFEKRILDSNGDDKNKEMENCDKITESEMDILPRDKKALCTKIVLNKNQRTNSARTCKSGTPQLRRNSNEVNNPEDKKRRNSRSSESDNLTSLSLDDLTSKRLFIINETYARNTEDLEYERILKEMTEYEISLSRLMATIIEWETGKTSESAHKAAKNVKKKTSTTTFITNASEMATEKFSTWHVRAEDPWDRKMYDAVVLYLATYFDHPSSDTSSENVSLLPVLQSRTYSVLKEYETLPKSSLLNETFTLLSYKPEKRLTALNSLKIVMEHSVTNLEMSKLQKSKVWSSTPALSGSNLLESTDIEARWSLHPCESRKFKVVFRPSDEGRFQTEFLLTLVNNPDVTVKISIEGISAIPRLDMIPASIFDRVKYAKVSEAHEPTYFLDTETYNFGNILVKNKQNRLHKKYTKFSLRNISIVPACVSFFLENQNFECFEINPQEIVLNPDETQFVNIAACSQKLGSITDNLILSIKYNDQPETIKLECSGIELNVEFDPKLINLDRVLLYSTEYRIVTIRNNSPITIYWRSSIDTPTSQIGLSPTQGKIKYKGSCEIELQYHAYMINEGETIIISFEILLHKDDVEPASTGAITVIASTYEIKFELKSENPIDFKSIPIGSTNGQSFTIKNLGLYEIKYEIRQQEVEILKKLVDTTTIATLDQNFKIHPTAGSMPPKKQITINMSYTPSNELTLKSVPLYKCVIIEPYKDIGQVQEYLLNMSAISYYTRFFIEPYPILNFGTLALKATKTMQLKIENTGDFPFEYSIINQTVLRKSESSSDKRNDNETNRKKARGSSQVKGERNTAKRSSNTNATKWGPFSLDKNRGELVPRQTDILTVRCNSDTIGDFEEKIAILVPNCLPTLEENCEVSLIANISVAKIDFENYEEMFTESRIVNSFEECFNFNEFCEHAVFAKITKSFHFRNVCVGSLYTSYVTLRNTSAVNGDVIIELLENSSPADAFEVNINRLSIPPMSKQSFSITFAPSVLAPFRCELSMKLDLPSNIETQAFTMDLEGESCIPQIRVIEFDSMHNGNPSINFGMSLISETRVKIFKIENVGQVATECTIELLDDLDTGFGIYLDQDKNKVACGCANDENDNNKVTFCIIPEEIINVNVQFLPTKVEKCKGRLKILIDKNPYENIEVSLIGEGFTQSVVLENLEIIGMSSSNAVKKTTSRESMRKRRRDSAKQGLLPTQSISKTLFSSPLMYKLDYEKCFLSKMSKVNFTMVNKTADRYFRFEWSSHPNVLCIPEAGHLAPNSFKDITATFLSSEPTLLIQVPLDCIVNEILLAEPIVLPSWDTRQTKVSWMEKYPSAQEFEVFQDEDVFVKKVIKETVEPMFEVVPSTLQTMQVLVSALADYSDYSCDIESIDFDDTLMFQATEYKFILQNAGKVNLEYSWFLTMDEQYPVRMDHINLEIDTGMKPCTSLVRDRCNQNNTVFNGIPSFNDEQPKKKLRIKSQECDQVGTSDLFSSSAALTDRSTDSWIEGENTPFVITPDSGTLSPEEEVECTLKFMPIDVFEYKAHLQCKLENLNPVRAPLNITINAKSLLPYCHFEVENSDYLTSGRRNINLPWPPGYSFADSEIISKIRVVEFAMLGIGECHTRCIHLINPTTEDYSYHWSRLSNELIEKMPVFHCLSETGIAEKGRRTKIPFTTVPESVGLFESFWQFEIKKYNLKTVFLIVANVTEPSVLCSNAFLKLDASTIGELQTSSFNIINNEACPLSFQIKANSLYSDGRFQAIKISPMSGILNPDSCQIFNIEYTPSLVGEYTFNVQCQIERLKSPLHTVIMANVMEILPKAIYTDMEGQEVEIKENGDNIIDFGQLMLCEPVKIKFKILNIGQIEFDYSWNLCASHQNAYKLWITEPEGTVDPDSDVTCNLELMASQKVIIQNNPFALKIKNGPTYRLKLNASAKKPPLEFSFSSYDFGPCYIQTQSGFFYSVELIIMNHQKMPCLVNCEFDDTPYMKADLHKLSQAIPSNTATKISIHFQPIEERFYRGVLYFSTSNQKIKKAISVIGEGVPYRIHLKNPCDAVMDLGTLLVGKCLCRKVRIINEGRLPVALQVVVIESSSEEILDSQSSQCLPEKQSRRKKDDWQPCNSSLTLVASDHQITLNSISNFDVTEFVKFSPTAALDLKPNRELEITIKFKAVQRIKLLKVQLGLQVDSSLFPLTIVKANCTSACLHLNRTYISFGAIFEGCTTEEKLILVNNGDIGSRFTWCAEKMLPYFQIKPLCGYSAPGSEITFTFTFKPTCQTNYIQEEALLALEEHKNLTVSLTGNCCPFPETMEIIDFTTQACQLETKEIQIRNDSDQTWHLKPIILGEHFITATTITAAPKSIESFEITYKPQKEIIKQDLHKAKLVIVLPDGKRPILYELQGRCTQAVVSEKIVRETSAKKRFVETLTMYNNSNRRSTFDCKVELVGNNTSTPKNFRVDVPAKSQAYHEFPFYFDYEGQFLYKITFDDHRDNYQCYEIEFTVISPEVQGVIELTTHVRTSVFHTLKIVNPLEHEGVTFDASCSNEDVIVHGLPVLLASLGFKNVQVEYLPLLPCNMKVMLVISSEILGSMFYELHLVAKSAPPEKAIHVKSSLGSFTNFVLRIKNYSKYACGFDMEVDEPSFSCPKTIAVSESKEAPVDVRFEPHSFETVNATIKAKSLSAGEFVFSIIGQATLPQPRGPFIVTPSTPASIAFTNVFLQTKVFEFSVDNIADFKVASAKATVASKKSYEIIVRLLKKKLDDSVNVGKLTVTCTDQALAGVKWIYYLRGTLDK